MVNKYKNVKVVVRPPTPSVEMPENAPGEGDALSRLQSVVRGRSIQLDMEAGRTRKAALITEMRKVHSGTQTPRTDLPAFSEDDKKKAARDIMLSKMLSKVNVSS